MGALIMSKLCEMSGKNGQSWLYLAMAMVAAFWWSWTKG